MKEVIDRGQGAYAFLRAGKPFYRMYDDVLMSVASKLYQDWKKLVSNPQVSKTWIRVPLEYISKTEQHLQGIQASQFSLDGC